jgi:glutamate racemase
MKTSFSFLLLIMIFFFSCSHPAVQRISDQYPIVEEIAHDPASPFFVDFAHYPKRRAPLPVGVFDSGTGGLAVLEVILTYDAHNNRNHAPGADGIPDFADEKFEYLADDANMPYGRYDAEGKADFLRELVIKDVRFLLGNTYYLHPADTLPQCDKEPVKTIVIACNTATSFGLETVRAAMKEWGAGVRILGIVEAGVREALQRLKGQERVTVGILATEGTCASQGYPRTLEKMTAGTEDAGKVTAVQQAGIGLAGAIDGDKNYLDPQATAPRSAEAYHGPRIGDTRYPIDTTLLKAYAFDTTGNALLIQKDAQGRLTELQLNSVENYIRYMVTGLAEKMVQEHPDGVLKEVILGCTHYPYYAKEIKEHFLRLRESGERYAAVISPEIEMIDPAASLAAQLYDHLQEKKLWGDAGNRDSRFFISVPNPLLPDNRLDSLGRFTYAYKYGRGPDRSLQYVKIVPFSEAWIAAPVRARLQKELPVAWKLIRWE